ncbi:AzlC family ABC transporter permease [Anderseniella sp. Alg231-50]|uniref:AzlC family ABC transporter permease n=1 Tax=Anderseniella sp. Alg231-50 TaxID=1922226 RepID=UPI000D54E6F9
MQVTGEVVISAAGVRRGMRTMFALALFIIPYGMAFGVAAIDAGMPATHVVTMSVFVFSGAAQFASLELWTSASIISLLLVVLAVSARFVLLGASLSPWINRLSRPQRLAALAVLSDPNFADSLTAFKNHERDIGRLLGGGLVLWAAWIIGTAAGAVVGSSFGDLHRFGIDVLMPSYFAALLLADWLSEWQGARTWLPAVAAALTAILGLHVLPPGWNIVGAAVAGGVIGGFIHGR